MGGSGTPRKTPTEIRAERAESSRQARDALNEAQRRELRKRRGVGLLQLLGGPASGYSFEKQYGQRPGQGAANGVSGGAATVSGKPGGPQPASGY